MFDTSTTHSGEPDPLAFSDPAGCRSWLASLPLTNGAKIQAALAQQLSLLNQRKLPALMRFELLELLRDSVLFAQRDCARRFTGRPLPLDRDEQLALDANRALWQVFCNGYQLCLQACLDGEAGILPRSALVARRALETLGAEQFDYYSAAHEPAASFWQRLHGNHLATEWLGVRDQDVGAAYVLPLLLHASSPFQLRARLLQTIHRWLTEWSKTVAILVDPQAAAPVPPLAVDLAACGPATRDAVIRESVRWLDVSALVRQIHANIVALREGATPASLDLGTDISENTCLALLRYLYEQLTKGGNRVEARQASGDPVWIVCGHAAIHHQLTGQPFSPPNQAVVYDSWWRRQEYAMFGGLVDHGDDDFLKPSVDLSEIWRRLDESPGGLRLTRPLDHPGARMATGTLIAFRTAETGEYRLGIVRWVMATANGELRAGIQAFAGAPQPVAVRPTGLGPANEHYKPGFLLPEAPALRQRACVVIPATFSREGRIVEIFDDDLRSVRLTRLVHRGTDFEVVAYSDQ
jgi:hypothetical protein